MSRQHHSAKRISGSMIRKAGDGKQRRSDPSISHSGCDRTLARTSAGRAKFARLLCGEGKLEPTEFFFWVSKGVGWLIPDCAQLSHPPTHWHAGTCHEPWRGPSDSPTSPEGVGRLFFTARIERPPFYRGGSASKKNGLPAPSHPSEAARCASKGDGQATPSSFAAPTSSPPS